MCVTLSLTFHILPLCLTHTHIHTTTQPRTLKHIHINIYAGNRLQFNNFEFRLFSLSLTRSLCLSLPHFARSSELSNNATCLADKNTHTHTYPQSLYLNLLLLVFLLFGFLLFVCLLLARAFQLKCKATIFASFIAVSLARLHNHIAIYLRIHEQASMCVDVCVCVCIYICML